MRKSNLYVRRILYIGANYSGGGVAAYINNIVDNLAGPGFEFYAVVDKFYGNRALSQNITVVEVPTRYGILNFFQNASRLKCAIQEIKPDVVHLHTARAGLIGVYVASKINLPVVYSGHAWRFEQKRSSLQRYVFRKMERYISMRSDFVTFLTTRDRNIGLAKSLVKSENSVAINTRITNDNINNPVYSLDNKRSINPLVINIGEVTDRKDPCLFLKVAKHILGLNPSVQFEWLGGGDKLDSARRYAVDLGISNSVKFWGQCESKIVQSRLEMASVMLFTSCFEGVPLAILESKLKYVPIVSTNYPGVEAAVNHQRDGYIFDRCNPISAAEYVNELLTNVDLHHKFAESGFQYAVTEHCGPELMANEFNEIYKKLS